MRAIRKFKISVKHNPFHSYYFVENIEAASLRGAKQTNIYKEYIRCLNRGRYASIMIEQVEIKYERKKKQIFNFKK